MLTNKIDEKFEILFSLFTRANDALTELASVTNKRFVNVIRRMHESTIKIIPLKMKTEELQDIYLSCIISVNGSEELRQVILSESIVETLDDIFNNLVNLLEVYPKVYKFQNLSNAMNNFKNSKIILAIPKNEKFNKCECGKEMEVYSSESMLRCEHCGIAKVLRGVVFEESPCYVQEGQRSKNSDYDPNGHGRRWINRIQAKSNKKIKTEDVEKIRQEALRRATYIDISGSKQIRSLNNVRCSTVRNWLKTINKVS